ncbi:MAG: HNH endonuclease [Kiritimatiellia bacterium]
MTHPEITTRTAFREYLLSENKSGSNKAASYLRAMDLLEGLLRDHPLGFGDCRDLWSVASVERLNELLLRVTEEQKNHENSPWFLPEQPSYLGGGFIKAALGHYRLFLVAHQHEQTLLDLLRTHQGDPDELAAILNQDPDLPDFLETELEGKEAIRQTKVRINQSGFRRVILEIYNHRCCVTGLDLPDLCIASHIIPWAENTKTRMDPRNGLCLSATYDRAFDSYLITFDEDYRLIVSKEIRDHYRNEHARELFEKKAGQVIHLPDNPKRRPLQEYLDVHRKQVAS